MWFSAKFSPIFPKIFPSFTLAQISLNLLRALFASIFIAIMLKFDSCYDWINRKLSITSSLYDIH